MANISILLLFSGLVLLGFTLERKAQLGPKPEDPLTREGIAYEHAVRSQVMPWQRLVWVMFAFSVGFFYASDLCNLLLRR